MLQLNTENINFDAQLAQLLATNSISDKNVIRAVEKIIHQVRSNGDKALLNFSAKFDKLKVTSVADLIISKNKLKQAFDKLTNMDKQALNTAARRIKNYHQKQQQHSWLDTEPDGTQLGQKITPLDKVGIYVPGGKACYPSSVLMNAIPAQVADVRRIIMIVPAPNNQLNSLVLAAAFISGVDKVIKLGGAHGIAALAYGTETIDKVDKIVGPGNIFVTTAKRLVFGQVGIDMIAGPSEILIIADGSANPDWIAMDLFSQAEHDEDAQAILLTTDINYLTAVKKSINKLLPTMNRADIIKTSLAKRGALIKTKSLQEAFAISNKIAPEHLELSIKNPKKYLDNIKNAGAIFLGILSSEALGDYCAGPNHVLPTAGSAKFSSPLGVYDFQKRSSIIHISKQSAKTLGKIAAHLAHKEGLTAHQQAALLRID